MKNRLISLPCLVFCLCPFFAVITLQPMFASILQKMKVTDHIKEAKDTVVSFEILPPLKGKTIESI
jgi:hypothetical protein